MVKAINVFQNDRLNRILPLQGISRVASWDWNTWKAIIFPMLADFMTYFTLYLYLDTIKNCRNHIMKKMNSTTFKEAFIKAVLQSNGWPSLFNIIQSYANTLIGRSIDGISTSEGIKTDFNLMDLTWSFIWKMRTWLRCLARPFTRIIMTRTQRCIEDHSTLYRVGLVSCLVTAATTWIQKRLRQMTTPTGRSSPNPTSIWWSLQWMGWGRPWIIWILDGRQKQQLHRQDIVSLANSRNYWVNIELVRRMDEFVTNLKIPVFCNVCSF